MLNAWELLCFWFLSCLLFIDWFEASKQIYFWKVVVHRNKLMHDSSDSKNQSIKLQNIDEEPNEDKFLDNDENCSDEREQSIGKKRIHRKSDISNFIMKTYRILEEKRNASIIEWTDGGDCFIVRNKEQFENQILPKFFKHRKFSSFVRQLNMYDFHKIRKEKEIPIFKHKFFKMGCFDLLHKIKRKSGDEMRDDEENPHSLNNQVVSTQNNIMNMPHATHLNKTKSYNIFEQIELITQQNSELRSSINEISKKINHLQVSRSKRKEKLMKIMSSIIYFEMAGQATEEQTCFRDLQNNILMDEDPLSLTEYTAKVGNLYRIVRKNLIR